MDKKTGGFTLLEFMISITILGIIATSFFLLYGGGLRGVAFSSERTEFVYEVQENLNHKIAKTREGFNQIFSSPEENQFKDGPGSFPIIKKEEILDENEFDDIDNVEKILADIGEYSISFVELSEDLQGNWYKIEANKDADDSEFFDQTVSFNYYFPLSGQELIELDPRNN